MCSPAFVHGHHDIREEYRIVVDVTATQIEQPCTQSSLHEQGEQLHAISSSALSTSTAARFLVISSRTRDNLLAAVSPANSTGNMFMACVGRDGRSAPHTVSTRFVSLATKAMPYACDKVLRRVLKWSAHKR